MCGRYALRVSVPELARALGVEPPADLAPRFNIAPTQPVAVLRVADGRREVTMLRWGLIPAWSGGPDARYSMFNARIEGIASKPAYRGPVRRRRCLIPADGWYEWQKAGARKQPWLMHRPDDAPFCFAGLWDVWHDDSRALGSCTILTAPAHPALAHLHARMPVIAPATAWSAWLDPANEDAETAIAALGAGVPGVDEGIVATPVSTRVNDARHDGPDCVEALTGD